MLCVTYDGLNFSEVAPLADGSCPSASYVLLSATESALAYAPMTASDILYAWTWGAGSVLFMWAFGIAIGAATSLIHKL